MLLRTTFCLLLAISATARGADEASLFERLGGERVMTRVVDQMVAKMVQDPGIAATLEGIDLARFSHKLYVHLCATTGGPCVYSGDDLHTVHAGMNITRAQLEVSTAALAAALDANSVGEREKAELLRLRAPMKEEILR